MKVNSWPHLLHVSLGWGKGNGIDLYFSFCHLYYLTCSNSYNCNNKLIPFFTVDFCTRHRLTFPLLVRISMS